MVKRLLLIASFIYSFTLLAQERNIPQQFLIYKQYKYADSLMKARNYIDAYKILKVIEPLADKRDSAIYPHIIWDYTIALSALELEALSKENWRFSLSYGIEALGVIKKGNEFFDGEYPQREYWMFSNIIVSYFGLGYPEKAKEYQDKLYAAHKERLLPEGIDKSFNFEFFKWNGNNVWGDEYYTDRGDANASKIVYYIYNTNPDGNDKDLLYRIHMTRATRPNSKGVKTDYVLSKELETATNDTSGTFYAYTYNNPVNYNKLRADVRQVLKGVYAPPPPTAPLKKKPVTVPKKK
jgi:hypothetical protein